MLILVMPLETPILAEYKCLIPFTWMISCSYYIYSIYIEIYMYTPGMLPNKCLAFSLNLQFSISDSLTHMYSILQLRLDANKGEEVLTAARSSIHAKLSVFFGSSVCVNMPIKNTKKEIKSPVPFCQRESSVIQNRGRSHDIAPCEVLSHLRPYMWQFSALLLITDNSFHSFDTKAGNKKNGFVPSPECQSPDATPYIVHV